MNPSAPPVPHYGSSPQSRFDALTSDLGLEYTIKQEVRHILCGSKKVIIIDNSPSMNSALNPKHTHLDPERFGGVVKRYTELKELLKQVIPILAIDSPNGVDVWWINNPVKTGVLYWREGITAYDDIASEMEFELPSGSTPLVPVLQAVLDKYTSHETSMHCMVFLDGEPDGREQGKRNCCDIIRNRNNPKKNIINFVACTDNDDEIAWLNRMDKYPGIDIVDDYNSERAEVLRAGRVKKFSYSDYVVKACIGAASPVIDKLDEMSFARRLKLLATCS